MSPKKRVLKAFPEAYCKRGAFRFTVWPRPRCSVLRGNSPLGGGWSAAAAWQDAALNRRVMRKVGGRVDHG